MLKTPGNALQNFAIMICICEERLKRILILQWENYDNIDYNLVRKIGKNKKINGVSLDTNIDLHYLQILKWDLKEWFVYKLSKHNHSSVSCEETYMLSYMLKV